MRGERGDEAGMATDPTGVGALYRREGLSSQGGINTAAGTGGLSLVGVGVIVLLYAVSKSVPDSSDPV